MGAATSTLQQFWPNLKDDRMPLSLKDGQPDPFKPPIFDPMLGFPEGRREREMHFTREELIDADVPKQHRDYCAHKYIDFIKCNKESSTFEKIFKQSCSHAKHVWYGCLYEDTVHRYKEYERERRLLARQKRRIQMGLEEDPNAPQEQTM